MWRSLPAADVSGRSPGRKVRRARRRALWNPPLSALFAFDPLLWLRGIARLPIARVLRLAVWPPPRAGPNAGAAECAAERTNASKRASSCVASPAPKDRQLNLAAMLLLAPAAVVAGVLARPLVLLPSANPFAVATNPTGAAAELPHVVDPHARGEDVCLRSPPLNLPGMEIQAKWRLCEPWELEAKTRRLLGGGAAMPPRP